MSRQGVEIVIRLRMRLIVLIGVTLGAGLGLAGPAGAAPAAVEALEVAKSSASLAYPRVHVSPTGEQGVVWLDTNPSGYAYRSRWRKDGDAFGPVDELTTQLNIEEPGFAFNRQGQAFVYYGESASPGAQYAIRQPGGPIGAFRSLTPCRRWVHAAVASDGRLAVACSRTQVTPPPDNAVLLRSDGIGKSFSAPAAPFASVYDNFIRPEVVWGKDGQLVLTTEMLDVTTTPAPATYQDLLRAYVLTPTGVATPFEVDVAPYNATQYGLSAGGTAIAGDGAVVIASTSDAAGAKLFVRPLGAPAFAATPLPSWGRVAKPQTDGAGAVHALVAKSGPPYEYGTTTRAVGGTFGPVTALTSPRPNSSYVIDFIVAEDGTEYALFTADDGPATVRLRTPGAASFGSPVAIAPEGSYIQHASLTGDGDLLVAWVRQLAADDFRVFVGGVDSGKPPKLSLDAPAKAIAGEPVRFSASVSDPMGIRSVSWKFGDGASASGTSVGHTFARAGRYEIEVTATDRAGNSSSEKHVVEVSGFGDRPARLHVSGPKKVKFKVISKKGVRYRLRANESVRVVSQLIARPRAARISAAGDLVLAERSLRLGTGRRLVKLKPSARLLGKKARNLRLKVRFAATDTAGNTTVVTRSLRVRR